MDAKQQRFSILYLVGALVVLVWLQSLQSGHRQTIPYSDFKALLRAGKVSELTVGAETIAGKLSLEGIDSILPKEEVAALRAPGGKSHDFATTRVEDPGLEAQLEAGRVAFTGEARNLWSALLGWLLPILLMIGFWSLVMRRMHSQHEAGGLMAIGKSKAKVYVERSTGVTFQDVAGIDEARAELEELVEFLRNPARYHRLGGRIPRGALLVGAPGTGKTLLAKAVAGEAHVPFFSLTGSDFVEMFVGVGAARVRDLFSQAQQHAPAIIFIDELDALGRARAADPVRGANDEREQTLNQLLAEMDGFDTARGLIVLAATNRPEILDPALLRPGRFDRKIVVDRPDLRGREQILRLHAHDVTLGPDVDLAAIAARTPGFVGADLANLVNEAALLAARRDKEAIGAVDFDEAIDRVIAGLERKSRVLSPKEKAIVAHHEAGHALVAESRPRADRVAKISIIPRGVAALGYTQQQPTEDRYLMTRAELLDRLDVLLGGREAEALIYGDVSTGAQDDLRRGTDLARHMVTAYGMSDKLGLATFEQGAHAVFLDIPVPEPRQYSEETARAIDAEVRELLAAAQRRVRDTLTERRPQLEALAVLLMKQEVVDRQALDRLLAGAPAPGEGAHAAVASSRSRDPVCGMELDPAAAAATLEHAGIAYHFCSGECRAAFAANPATYVGASGGLRGGGVPWPGR